MAVLPYPNNDNTTTKKPTSAHKPRQPQPSTQQPPRPYTTTNTTTPKHSHKIFDIPRENIDRYEINLMAPEDVVPMVDRLRGITLQMQCVCVAFALSLCALGVWRHSISPTIGLLSLPLRNRDM